MRLCVSFIEQDDKNDKKGPIQESFATSLCWNQGKTTEESQVLNLLWLNSSISHTSNDLHN